MTVGGADIKDVGFECAEYIGFGGTNCGTVGGADRACDIVFVV